MMRAGASIVDLTLITINLMIRMTIGIVQIVYRLILKPVWKMLKPEFAKAGAYVGNKICQGFNAICGSMEYLGITLKHSGKMLFYWLFNSKKYKQIKEAEQAEAEENSNVRSIMAYKARKEAQKAKNNEQAEKIERRRARI